MSPPHGIQAFCAVPLPVTRSLIETRAARGSGGSSSVQLWGAALVGVVLLGSAIGYGVQVALRRDPPAAEAEAAAPVPNRIDAVRRALAKQRAANRPTSISAELGSSQVAKVAAPRPAARVKAGPGAKPVKHHAAPQPHVSASSKQIARPPKFSDEPADPE